MCLLAQLLLLILFLIKFNFSSRIGNSTLLEKISNVQRTLTLSYLKRKCKSSTDCNNEHEICYTETGWCACKCQQLSSDCNCDFQTKNGIKPINNITAMAIERQLNEMTKKKIHVNPTNTYIIKNYDVFSTSYTLGFGFGLPIALVLLIIGFFIYFLRKKYSLHLPSTGRISTTTLGMVNSNGDTIDTYPSSSFNRSSYLFNNRNSRASVIIIHGQIHRSLIIDAVDTPLNGDESGGLYDDNLLSTEKSGEFNQPPVYEDISNYSEIDKLPTYGSFRRKSKSNALL